MENESLPNTPGQKKAEETTGTENLVRQHMADPNHIITDEDLMNVEIGKFDVDEVGEENLLPRENVNEVEEEKKDDNDDTDPSPANPWVVIQ